METEPEPEGLTKDEYDRLVGLINCIVIADCFGVKDVLIRQLLENKATNEQLTDAYAACKLNVNDYYDL